MNELISIDKKISLCAVVGFVLFQQPQFKGKYLLNKFYRQLLTVSFALVIFHIHKDVEEDVKMFILSNVSKTVITY